MLPHVPLYESVGIELGPMETTLVKARTVHPHLNSYAFIKWYIFRVSRSFEPLPSLPMGIQQEGGTQMWFLVMLVALLNRATAMDCDWNMTKAWQDAKRRVG